jgi:hypothetical protein
LQNARPKGADGHCPAGFALDSGQKKEGESPRRLIRFWNLGRYSAASA